MAGKKYYSCEFCGKKVLRYPSQVKGKTFMCSRKCPEYVSAIVKRECVTCGKEFETYRSTRKQRCSRNCPGYFEVRTCEVCGETFTWRKVFGTGRFCKDDCRKIWFSKNFSEENSPHWRGGLTQSAKYCAKRRSIYSKGDDIDRYELFSLHDWMCHICDLPIDPDLRHPHHYAATIDHIVPISRGGEHVWDNVRPAHALCNWQKSSHMAD